MTDPTRDFMGDPLDDPNPPVVLRDAGLRERHAATFGRAAAAYARSRPAYPDEAIDRLLGPSARTVLDLGAGTGKLTRQLADRGLQVTAVDPSPDMLTELRRLVPEADARVGSAEATGLADDAVDVVLVAQAWHWVDPTRAVPETARVLRPGGTLGLLWNLRENRTDFATRLADVLGGEDQTDWQHVDPSTVPGSPFGPAESFDVAWTHRMPADHLVDLISSRSYVIAMEPAERAALLGRIAELVSTHPETRGREVVEIPYRTRCLRHRLHGNPEVT